MRFCTPNVLRSKTRSESRRHQARKPPQQTLGDGRLFT